MSRGSLVFVGTGIKIVGQLSQEAIAHLRIADKVLYVVSDFVAEEVLKTLNPDGVESLAGFYERGKPRKESYFEMVERIITCVRSGLKTCVAFYGHPGVFTFPTHEAMRRAREGGVWRRWTRSIKGCAWGTVPLWVRGCGSRLDG